jgi:DNA-binding NarL/FixJ family response regulator
MMETVRIIIADDHRLLRAGLRMLLTEMPGVVVLAEAANGREALDACDASTPDLVLLDIAMPVLGGLDALRELKDKHPATRVLMLSMLDSEEHVLQALRLGASGYLLKDAAPAELALAIEAVMRGDTWLSSAISRPVVDGYMARVATSSLGFRARPDTLPTAGEGGILTPRQQEVLRLLAEGNSTKKIAFSLGLSIKTIETYRAQIMERLDVHDVAGLVRYAIRNGMVSV